MTAMLERDDPPAGTSTRPPPDHRRGPARRRSGAGETGMPAGRALQIMVGALAVALVFNSAAMVRAGEGMEPGVTRGLVLALGRPVHAVAQALWLDRPRRVLGWIFDSDVGGGRSSPLLSAPASGSAGPASPQSTAGANSTGPLADPVPSVRPSAPAETAQLATRTVSAAEPLRLLITGDSMTEFLGPALLKVASAGGRVRGSTVTRYGTGLVRPDFFDWSREALRLMKAGNPEAVVVMMGGNDGQGIRLPTGTILREGSPEWVAEYQRRAGIVMRAFTDGGARRVYWVGMPVPRSPRLGRDYGLLNGALAAAAREVPGIRYVDVATRLSAGGRYADYLPDDAGRTVLARARDGIHLSRDGARIAAGIVLRAVNTDWRLQGG